jgi:hypothetical protein
VRALASAVGGLVLVVVGAGDFVYGGGVLAFFAWPLAIGLELVAAYSAVRALGRGDGRGPVIGAFVIATAVAVPAVVGLLALLAPKQ